MVEMASIMLKNRSVSGRGEMSREHFQDNKYFASWAFMKKKINVESNIMSYPSVASKCVHNIFKILPRRKMVRS